MCHGSVTLTITVLLRFSRFSQLKVLYLLLADLKTVPEMFGMIVSVFLFFNNFRFGVFFLVVLCWGDGLLSFLFCYSGSPASLLIVFNLNLIKYFICIY